MKVVFCDFDGVLNCARSQSRAPFYDGAGTWYVGLDSNKLRNLAKIIQETNAKIVLTTTWREHYEIGAYKQMDPVGKYINNKFRMFDLKIYDKIVDGKRFDRGKGVKIWLEQHPEVTDFVILDDEDMGYFWVDYERYEPHFVKTLWDGNGLTENCTNAAIRILNGELGSYIDRDDLQWIYM